MNIHKTYRIIKSYLHFSERILWAFSHFYEGIIAYSLHFSEKVRLNRLFSLIFSTKIEVLLWLTKWKICDII